jgi:hypothetical protein
LSAGFPPPAVPLLDAGRLPLVPLLKCGSLSNSSISEQAHSWSYLGGAASQIVVKVIKYLFRSVTPAPPAVLI